MRLWRWFWGVLWGSDADVSPAWLKAQQGRVVPFEGVCWKWPAKK